MKNIRSFFTTVSKSKDNEEEQPSKKAKLDDKVDSIDLVGVAVVNDCEEVKNYDNGNLAITESLQEVKENEPSNATEYSHNNSTIEEFSWPPFQILDESWKCRLGPEIQKPYFQRLLRFLETECRTHTVYPPSQEIFNSLCHCSFDKVKVVVIGQDPYHGPGQANGMAFSVRRGVPLPPSLKNMVQELQKDPKTNISPPSHGDLTCWSDQGVLLLNTVLTVRKAEANSHQKKGWEEFTDAIVRELSKKEGLVYLLWGKPAQTKCAGINTKKNVILKSSHPSPLSAYKTSEAFMGSRIFSRCNDELEKLGKEPIDWNIQ